MITTENSCTDYDMLFTSLLMQLSPLAYANDTHALLGCVMDHDDTLEKGPNTKLDQGFQDTARLWENTFGQPYEKAGSMSRGTQPLSPTPLPSDDGGFERVPVALPWSYQPKDVNQYLKILSPRYVVEVNTFSSALLLRVDLEVDCRGDKYMLEYSLIQTFTHVLQLVCFVL